MANYKPSGGGLAITEDSARFSLAASGTLTITPATGEFDYIQCSAELAGDYRCQFTDGTNFTLEPDIEDNADALSKFLGSTPTVRVKITNTDGAATRYFQRVIATFK